MLNETAKVIFKSTPYKWTNPKTGEVREYAQYSIVFDDNAYNVTKFSDFAQEGDLLRVLSRKVTNDQGKDFCQVFFASKKKE